MRWRRSEQLVGVDGRQRLPPVAEGAELGHGEGLVLLFAQQREHVLHQLAQPAVSAEGDGMERGSRGRKRIEIMKGLQLPPSQERVGRQRKARLFSRFMRFCFFLFVLA